MRNLRAIFILWLRDLKRWWYDKPRIVASLGQPLLFLFVLGTALSPSFIGPEGVNFSKFIFPGIIGMTVLFTSVFSAMSIVWDREFGFLKEVLVAPISRWSIVVGKALGGSTVAMIQGTIMFLLGPLVGIKMGFLLFLKALLGMFLIAFAMSSLGIVIAAKIKEMEGFQVIVNFLIMPLFFLSGALFPLDRLPSWLAVLTRVDPMTYGVDFLRGVTMELNNFPLHFSFVVIVVFSLMALAIGVYEFSLED
ncbi:MAG: ABC transporter permease [Candidatus Margulisiibacteriota bacterium]